MARPKGSSDADQMKKYESFKKAYGTLKKVFEDEAYIAAFVIAFSIMEDRITAMYVVALRREQQKELDSAKRPPTLKDKINKLLSWGDFDKQLYEDILEQANARNALFHAAMWRLEDFTEEGVKKLTKVMKSTDKARKAQRKRWGDGLQCVAADEGKKVSKD